MTANAENIIVRVAAKGDGVTADGRHVAFSAPLDEVLDDGGLIKGPHHVEPPCRHFKECGGCSLQQLDAESYAQFVTDRVNYALEGQGLSPTKLHAPQISKPKSRVRASLRAAMVGNIFKLGFSGAGSHRIVDLQQCEIMHPELFAVIAPLRTFLQSVARRKHDMNIELTLADQGVDLLIKNYEPDSLDQHQALSEFAQQTGIARLSLDNGYGPETQWEPNPVTVTLGNVPVALPHSSFLQSTADGKDALIAAMLETVGDTKLIADLFAGLGTFSFALGGERKIYAAEGSRDAISALKSAANIARLQVFTEHRDLYRRPLSPEELNRFGAVILDPPRAGARDQIVQLAKSEVPKICYISCNPASFARDAKTLCEAGYKLKEVWPVGQFLWSTHVELVSSFVR
ncbi:class I SAM-dependent RNA methyltransferase [Parasphingorhabdus halotolerans]|uniref:Class I SAM-dependent RNA methyltransferase n=1 Tax=Parasphingorhabdus halotolerans TaxID=2725558 RepID=A0A6H2DKX3_9SPHN|nr:class I SAM-dependent RNA methyltransferase [Parasphingorhabdus halotolerans]QJB68306.1 class I SAM-dependent RNA methyltransferase [Parasphingorhabdus halotolerans]